ncbi:MAG TPA: hypothetical protein VHB25_08050 [Gemmatimonadaceae bacterium]|nr:hypothetical protein [Gemmatimonadaceae bacterium]
MPKKGSYRALPTLGHVALLWAERHGIELGTRDPAEAQRALEIALDAMPFTLRIGASGWSGIRRGWCRAWSQPDPRAHLRHEKRGGVWTHWLATQGLARGDIITADEGRALEAALPLNAEPYLPLLSPLRRAWRWAKKPGIVRAPGYALLLQRTKDGGILVDCLATIRWKPKERPRYDAHARAERARRETARRRQARLLFRPGRFPGQYRPAKPDQSQRERPPA